MARLDIERQKRLEPTRIEYAVSRIQEIGFEIVQRDNTQIQFIHKGQTVTFFPYIVTVFKKSWVSLMKR